MGTSQQRSALPGIPPARSFLQTLLAALGFTVIFLLWDIDPGIESSQTEFYHWSGSPAAFFLPIVFHILAVWWALFLALRLAEKHPGRVRVSLWAGLLFFTPWLVYQNVCAIFIMLLQPRRRFSLPLLLGALIATSLLTAYWRPSWKPRFDKTVSIVATILCFAGLFGAFLLCKLAWYGAHAEAFTRRLPPLHTQAATAPQPHRVVWIVLDELSFDQTFEHRFPGLQLPAFDALAAQSTSFTNVSPPDMYTEVVLPSLITGVAFNKLQSLSSGGVLLRRVDSGKSQLFDPNDTVFRDALNAGYSTAVAGWFNPYCRIAPTVLDRCFWIHGIPATNMTVASGSVLSNTFVGMHELQYMLLSAAPARLQQSIDAHLRLPIDNRSDNQLHIGDYQTLHDASLTLLQDPSLGFVLLHLPIPHPSGIYDRTTGRFASGHSSYIDNLALADRCVAEFRRTLEQTGQWDSSTVVVMGDHSWRTMIWKPTLAWVREDDTASHRGQYDPRPAYLVKLPGQTASATIDTPYRAVNTRKLFDALFAHRINTPADLAAWARAAH